nr:MAG TPA: hypothetical protein [Crassvirales sp.]
MLLNKPQKRVSKHFCCYSVAFICTTNVYLFANQYIILN